MTKRKPFDFMRRKKQGFIRVWKTRGEHPIIKQAWSDGCILVFENRWDEFPDVPGNYKFDVKKRMIVPAGKNFPKFGQLIPKRKGYKEAKPLQKNGHLCLERIDCGDSYMMIVELQAEKAKALLDLEYYDYLEQNYGTSPCAGEWRIKGQDEPVLFLWDGEVKAVVMPIKGYGEEGRQ